MKTSITDFCSYQDQFKDTSKKSSFAIVMLRNGIDPKDATNLLQSEIAL